MLKMTTLTTGHHTTVLMDSFVLVVEMSVIRGFILLTAPLQYTSELRLSELDIAKLLNFEAHRYTVKMPLICAPFIPKIW